MEMEIDTAADYRQTEVTTVMVTKTDTKADMAWKAIRVRKNTKSQTKHRHRLIKN